MVNQGDSASRLIHPFQGTREEAADELERLLKLSIKDQMVADVPVGAFLSAVDSSTVAALMQSLAPGKSQDIYHRNDGERL